jgi:hypothetical protein
MILLEAIGLKQFALAHPICADCISMLVLILITLEEDQVLIEQSV